MVVGMSTLVLLGGVGLATPARAGSEGSASDLGVQERTVDPRPSTTKLALQLKALEILSHGRVDVRAIGKSNQGRPVWSATVGSGPRKILYVTQQHGDEPLTTPAAVQFLSAVGLGNSRWQRVLRSQVTIEVVVRANPDGHEHGWRYNYDPTADPEYGEKGKGYDINRYHDPAVAPEDNPATEAGLIQRRFAAFGPELVVDYHMQGRYLDAQGRDITSSVFWPNHPDVTTDKVALAKQVAVVAARGMTLAGGNVSQYPGGQYRGIARNGYGLAGAGSVLIEYSDLGPEHEQAQIRSARVAMLSIALATGSGALDTVDPALADKIPLRGNPVPGARTLLDASSSD